MINIQIISRIDVDKNFFFDYLFLVYSLKKNNITVNIYFIGEIFNQVILNSMLRNIRILDISDHVYFTKKSISVEKIEAGIDDYFINASIGNFVGYSSIECLERNFKTIFYNVDFNIHFLSGSVSFTKNLEELYDLFIQIHQNKKNMDLLIRNENHITRKTFSLTGKEKTKLLEILSQ